MNASFAVDTREIAQSIKGRKPPFSCPACHKSYRSATGILYHIGQIGPPAKVPRCLLGEDSIHGSPTPKSGPASPGGTPGTVRRRAPRRELTWAEAQRLVEVEFENSSRRIEIDNDLDVSLHSEEEGEDSCDKGQSSSTPRALLKRGRGSKGETPNRDKSASKSKNKGKRRSKLKTPGKESDGLIPLPKAEVTILDNGESQDAPTRESSYFRFVAQTAEDLDEMIEYDIDEEDSNWLSLLNEERRSQGHTVVPQEVFELLMDRLEKECCFESQSLSDGGEPLKNMYNIDENAVCCICNDGECHNTNAILFCDMCNLAVHQECYGVPYIPEGQWLCRRCLQSPSRGVDCALCPNKGGAFKQTIDGRWAHVICAIWIPEVQFSNPVFLEPIDGINEIPSARWKLTCYICRKRMGASIQCAKANCYVAFHVTCAQHASLHMKVSMAKSGEIVKTAFCDAHTPPAIKKKLERAKLAQQGEESSSSSSESEKEECDEGEAKEGAEGEGAGKGGEGKHRESKAIKKARKKMEEKRKSMVPIVNIPYVPQHRLDHIISQISLHKKSQFIPRLVSYWKLKRQSRNGVPLLRRLQASNKGQRAPTVNLTEEEREVLAEQLTLWKNLRHDLERARMLVELVRKREKLKREQLRFLHMINDLQLRPLNVVMKRSLDRLSRKDPADIFADPVSVEEVPDYHDVIKHPMDFGTMRKKVECNEYPTFDSFEQDFYHVWHNATIYNQKDTIYYRAATRIRDAGAGIMEQAKEQLRSAGVSEASGLHDPEVQEPPPLTPNTIAMVVREPMDILEDNDTDDLSAALGLRTRHLSTTSLSLDEQMDILQEQLEMVQTQCIGSARKIRTKNLKRELLVLRRQQKNESRKARNSDSDDQPSSPKRRRAPSIPRNAEELASHLLHGSLRMTASRQQILSHSGIRLEERANALQEEEKERIRSEHIDKPAVQEHEVFPESLDEEVGLFSDGEESATNVSSSDYEPDTEAKALKKSRKRSKTNLGSSSSKSRTNSQTTSSLKPPRQKHSHKEKERYSSSPIRKSKSDSYVTQLKSREVEHQRHRRKKTSTIPSTQNGSSHSRGPGRPSKQVWGSNESIAEDEILQRKSHRQKRRQRLNSGGVYCTSASEVEPEVNGFSTAQTTVATPDQVSLTTSRHINSKSVNDHVFRTRGRSNSSSQYETAGEGYSSEDKRLSPFSNRFSSIPSASSVEDLTAFEPLYRRRSGKKPGEKRKGSFGGGESMKKMRLTSESSDTASLGGDFKTKTINGLIPNGGQFEIKPLDLVWAKCRGYPSYPALVIDPDIPREGLNINGEKIQAPSDEVMGLRGLQSTATYLVRFFDGRRTWQWLPPEKIEPLGISSDYDHSKVAHSGHSKRSVKEAYNRAKQYQKRVARNAASISGTNKHTILSESEINVEVS